MILGLDHVAIAVADLPEATRRFVADLGFVCEGTEDVEAASTATAFLPVSGPTRIELVAPLRGEGPIQRHIERRGTGLHHLCFRVVDVDAAMLHLTARGYRFTTSAPTPGAHGTRVAWLHPSSTGGILIELAQHA